MTKLIARTALFSAALLATAGVLSAGERPNILYILTDQWRASAVGYAGDPNVKTPNLDKLATQSLVFRNAISVLPVCTPHRAALLTGRYPTSTGMFLNDLYLPSEELCMAEIFKQAGYDTGYIGKWHLDGHGRASYIPPERRQGFDYWKAAECDHEYNRSHYYEGDSVQKQFWPGYDAFAQTADAQTYVRAHAKSGKPFLLVLALGIPHFPHHTALQEYKNLYKAESIKLPPNVPEKMQAHARAEAVGYYAHCSAADKCVGDLLATLDEAGIAQNTILIFTSDHGEMLGSQGRAPTMKQVPWDESAHVPFLLRWPAQQGAAGRAIAEPLDTPDILPTLLNLAGIAIPKSVEGQDLAPLVRNERPERDRAALYMSVSPFVAGANFPEYRAVRTARYTYVRNVKGPWLMYDNQDDPYQMNNLVDKPEFAALQADLEKRLAGELKAIGDDFKPREFYLQKYGYKVKNGGAIGYVSNGNGPEGVQSPRH